MLLFCIKLDFFWKFCIILIKFCYAALLSLLKLVLSWLYPLASLFDPLFDTFLLDFYAFGCVAFLPFLSQTFWNLRNEKSIAFFSDCLSLLIIGSPFGVWWCSSWSDFLPLYRHEQSHWLQLNVLQVGRLLLSLSFIKYFLSQT